MTIRKINLAKLNSFVDSIEKFGSKWWGMLIISSAPFFVVFAPFLFLKRIFLDSDLITIVYPIYQFYQESLISGQSIYWNPNNFSGFPSYIGSMGFLSPLHYALFRLLPLFTAYNIIVFLNTVLALFFMWLLLRKIGLSFWAGLMGGLVYVFSTWFWIANITISNALPILPLLFLILWQIKKKTNIWFVLIGGLIIGYSWLSMHFNWLVMILTACFVFSIFLGWNEVKKWKIPLKYFLMCLIGTIIGLIIILPLLTYSDLSVRTHGLSYESTIGGALNLGDFLRYLLPNFKLSLFNLASSPIQLYLGILPLFFLIFAFKLKGPLVKFFTFLFLGCILIAIKYSPVFWIIHQLPVFDSFRGPHRWMFIGSFAAAGLVGFGLDNFLKYKKMAGCILKIFKWISICIVVIVILVTALFNLIGDKLISQAQNYFNDNLYEKTSGLPLEHYHKVIQGIATELTELVNLFNPKVFLPIIFILISYLVLKYFCSKKTWQKLFLPGMVLLVLFNFLFVFGCYHSSISKAELFQEPDTVKYIKQSNQSLSAEQLTRVFAFLPGFSEYQKLTVPYQPQEIESFIFQATMIAPSLNLLYNLESVDYYDNLMSRSMARILALIGSDRATMGDKLSDLNILPEEKAKILVERKKYLDLLGVRYVISVFPLDKQVFNMVFETKATSYDIPLYLYENFEARALVYLADQVETIEPNEELVYEKLLNESLEGKSIFIECLDCPKELNVNGNGEIILKKRENNFIELETKSDSIQWLVFSENFLPGWKAYVDNKETTIYMTNSVYMGIKIPEGEHKILFKFSYFYL